MTSFFMMYGFFSVWLLLKKILTLSLVYCHDITALQLTFNCVMSQTNKFGKHIDIKPNLALSYGEYFINAL